MKYFIAGFLGFFVPFSVSWYSGLNLLERSPEAGIVYFLSILLTVILCCMVNTLSWDKKYE